MKLHDIVAHMGLALLCLQLAIAQVTAAPVRLYPVDESTRDAGFQSYVHKLQAAVDRRDTTRLRKLVDTKEVLVGSHKGDKGWGKFVERWHPEDRAHGPVWSVLSEFLSLGFVQ